jgi:hypothetical protein
MSGASHAGVTEAWTHRYNNPIQMPNGESSRIVRDRAGNIVVAGVANDGVHGRDILIIKYSGTDGTILWERRYDGPAHGDDTVAALALDASGNVLVAGASFARSIATPLTLVYDCFTAKYAAATGNPLWQQRYEDPTQLDGGAVDMAVDSAGNAVVITPTHVLRYLSTKGTQAWARKTAGIQAAVGLDPNGNALVTSTRGAAKYASSDGHPLWNSSLDPDVTIAGSAVDPSGNLLIAGSAGNGRDDTWYSAKLSSTTGVSIWSHRGPGFTTAYDYGAIMSLAVDSRGNLLVYGYNNSGFKAWGWPVYSTTYTAKYASQSGTVAWSQEGVVWTRATFDANDNLVLTQGGFYAKYSAVDGHMLLNKAVPYPTEQPMVTDTSGHVITTQQNFRTTEYSSTTGAVIWQQEFIGAVNRTDNAQAVAVDREGNVLLTGTSTGTGGGYYANDIYTARYAAADGSQMWEHRYNSLTNLDDTAVAVTADREGNAIVTGASEDSIGRTAIYTAKYAAADGTLLWEQRQPARDHGESRPIGVVVDVDGNVIITGYADQYTARPVQYTAKYSGRDGTLIWENRYADPKTAAFQPAGFALDSHGNVVTAAPTLCVKYASEDGRVLYSFHPPMGVGAVALDREDNVILGGARPTAYNESEMYTAKFTASGKTLLWVRSYSNGVYGEHRVQALVLDGSGDVIVTGYSPDGTDAARNGYTARYASGDGALVWERRSAVVTAAIALNEQGDVIVAGGPDAIYTAKYAAATGSLVWERNYHAPARGPETVTGSHPLALGPGGRVLVAGTSAAYHDSLLLFGGTSALDMVTVVYRDLPPISIAAAPGGIRLLCSGDPGRSYDLVQSSTVTDPGSRLLRQPMPSAGLFEMFQPTVNAAGYYRLIPAP